MMFAGEVQRDQDRLREDRAQHERGAVEQARESPGVEQPSGAKSHHAMHSTDERRGGQAKWRRALASRPPPSVRAARRTAWARRTASGSGSARGGCAGRGSILPPAMAREVRGPAGFGVNSGGAAIRSISPPTSTHGGSRCTPATFRHLRRDHGWRSRRFRRNIRCLAASEMASTAGCCNLRSTEIA